MIPPQRISRFQSFLSKSLFPLLLCIGLRAFAQFSAATVAGVVQDSSKAAVTDASLKLINTQTGTENDSITSPEGGFLLAGIIPGAYTLQIERDGFATTHVNGITLNGGDIKRLLILMESNSFFVDDVAANPSYGLTLNSSRTINAGSIAGSTALTASGTHQILCPTYRCRRACR
jgi:Carboxypeptidase regulatory-like domain